MNLILRNCYPYPFPKEATEAEQDAISDAAGDGRLELAGVVHFEWLHVLTVEFDSAETMAAAQQATGWPAWGRALTLQAPTSGQDGYDQPAIIADSKAWCGFMLVAR